MTRYIEIIPGSYVSRTTVKPFGARRWHVGIAAHVIGRHVVCRLLY